MGWNCKIHSAIEECTFARGFWAFVRGTLYSCLGETKLNQTRASRQEENRGTGTIILDHPQNAITNLQLASSPTGGGLGSNPKLGTAAGCYSLLELRLFGTHVNVQTSNGGRIE